MWLAITMPIIIILCLVLIAVLWAKTGLLVALIVFARCAPPEQRWLQDGSGVLADSDVSEFEAV